ncbi:acetylserotonin O-methyltransferase [Methylobacterium organophilum]|uniref:Demethylspheroidene O-methyltransferase n=1 Tax=Methylobacterium organophilum TaxID=410 RepID=A0ABQ4T6A1_METOR|nr:acetylserotonin O-methyltransferase [Methylobacterium organophilum]GJE26162.1 Demethylspheroidene O-methyltransferase [Methylobacterium organophilum]
MPASPAEARAVAALPWRERVLAWRNRLVASPRFQLWAAGFPLTRGRARRNTRALFDLCAGFVYAQVLFACVRLDLFRLLQAGPLAAEAVARRRDLPPERAERLLKAAVSLGLLHRLKDGRFALADLGAAMIGNPAIAAMIEHHALLYADLADPVALLRGTGGLTRLARYWPYAENRDAEAIQEAAVAPYGGLMAASQAMIAQDVLDAISLQGRSGLLDVGGGEGAFAASVARRYPDLPLALFDLPAVARRAQRRLAEEGLGGRVACHGGSFHADPLPRGYDAVSLVRIVHDHDDAEALHLLRAAYTALPPGGRLILAEPMAGTKGAEPIGDAYFGFYLLAMGSGRPRTASELASMLASAGFEAIREAGTRRPLLVRVLIADRG